MAAARWRGRGIALSSWVFSAFAGDCALFLLAGEFVFFSRLSQFSSLSLVLLCWFFAGDFFFFFFFCRRDPFDFRCGFLFAPLYSGVFLLPLPQGAFFFFFFILLYCGFLPVPLGCGFLRRLPLGWRFILIKCLFSSLGRRLSPLRCCIRTRKFPKRIFYSSSSC